MTQSVEAVILTGPRRGEIVQLTEETLPSFSKDELDDIIAAIERLSTEFRVGTKELDEVKL